MTNIIIRDAARADLESIWLRGAEKWGIDHAVTYEHLMFDVFDLLAINPMLARPRNTAKPPLRAHPFRAHMILYRELQESAGIEIIRIVHGKADRQRLT